MRTGHSPAIIFDTPPAMDASGGFKNVVVYVCGGMTYEEAKAVRDLNGSLGCNAVLGGELVWRSQDFVQSFLQEK